MIAVQPAWRRHAAVLVLAAVIRILWAVLVPVVPVSDCAIYDGAAQRLAAGLPYTIDAGSQARSAHWPVGTSFMYSVVYRICDQATCGYTPVVVLNVLISLAVVLLSMMVVDRWFGARAGAVAGLLVALWPMHVEFTTIIASEPAFTACILAGLLAWPEPRGQGAASKESGRLLVSALCFAAATMIRPTALLLPVVLAGVDILRSGRVVLPVLRAGAAMLILLAAVSPWTIRNYHAFNRFVLVSTNGGTNMWMGNNPETTGYYQPPPAAQPGQNEAEWDKDLGQRARAFIRENPAAFVQRSIVKAIRLHDRETIGVAWNVEGLKQRWPSFESGSGATILKALSTGYWYLMLGLAAVGWVLVARRVGVWQAATHPAAVLFAYFTAVHAVMVIQDRYHFPVTPMVAAFASLPLCALADRRAASGVKPT